VGNVARILSYRPCSKNHMGDTAMNEIKDSGAYTSVPTQQPDFATMDLRQLSFTELCLLAIVLMLFFKWFIFDMFKRKL
jgi:hypothetical protein